MPESRILPAVVNGLDKYWDKKRGNFKAIDLLNNKTLESFAKLVYDVNVFLPEAPASTGNYPSWLYKDMCGGYRIHVSAKDEHGNGIFPVDARVWAEPGHRLFSYVTIIFHELGHLALQHNAAKIIKLGQGQPFPAMSKEQDWEAWLFAGCLRSFIVADSSVESREALSLDYVINLLLR